MKWWYKFDKENAWFFFSLCKRKKKWSRTRTLTSFEYMIEWRWEATKASKNEENTGVCVCVCVWRGLDASARMRNLSTFLCRGVYGCVSSVFNDCISKWHGRCKISACPHHDSWRWLGKSHSGDCSSGNVPGSAKSRGFGSVEYHCANREGEEAERS